MKKKISIELWTKNRDVTEELALKFKSRYRLEIKSIDTDTGSIFGYLEEKYFDKVEEWMSVIGVFESERFPGERLISQETIEKLKLTINEESSINNV